MSGDEEEKDIREIHREACVVDACVMQCCLEDEKYLDGMRNGGVDVAVTTVASEHEDFVSAIKAIDHFTQIIKERRDKVILATSVDDIEEAEEEGKIAIVYALQDARPIEDCLPFLRTFYKLGVRAVQLTYNGQNLVGNGCCEFTDCGLTYFGREVVEELNRLGIVVDVSHTGDRTTLDAIEYSKSPVVFTHAGIRSLCNTLRNKSDAEIVAMAERGGVIGISVFPPTLKLDQSREGRPTLADVLNQVDYATKLVGVDHVGLGFDANWKGVDEGWSSATMRYWRKLRPDVYGYDRPLEVYPPFPEGIDSHGKFLNVTEGLRARGYSGEDTVKILGGNWMRIFKEVWCSL